jgi:uncharacterized membrane protein
MIEIVPNWHPFVVHFAIGLLMVSVVLFLLASLFSGLPFTTGMTTAARWNLWLGTAFAVLSVMTGLQAYGTVIHDSAGHEAMHNHRFWAFITLGLFLVAFVLSLFETDRKHGASRLVLLILLAGFAAITVTGYLGAKNVYLHGIGVERLPDPEDHYHHQDKSESHAYHDHSHEHYDDDIESGDEYDEPANHGHTH